MQSDIVPPPRPETKTPGRQPMRSVRLRGHSLSSARQRLLGLGSFQPNQNLPQLEEQAAKYSPEPASLGLRKTRGWHHWSRKQKALMLLLVVILGAGGVFGYTNLSSKPAPEIKKVSLKAEAVPPPKPTTVASPLTGMQVAPELASRPVTGIMIENSLDARPQSGLQDAGVVYEAIAEGGITRFLALFQEGAPQYVGPVRSLRPYYIDFASPFQAGIAHVGGSPDALAQIRSGGRDLDQFANAGAYWRVSSRRAPHNMYTSFEKLDALNEAKGFTKSEFTSWKRKEEKALATPTAKTIDISISSALYNSHYDYDAASNTYHRVLGGKPHIITGAEADKTGIQLKPKVVIAMVMSYGLSGKYSVYGVTGSGTVYIFQDGGVTQGTWTKNDRGSQFVFKDQAGQEIALNAGQTWLTPITAGKLSYTPQ